MAKYTDETKDEEKPVTPQVNLPAKKRKTKIRKGIVVLVTDTDLYVNIDGANEVVKREAKHADVKKDDEINI